MSRFTLTGYDRRSILEEFKIFYIGHHTKVKALSLPYNFRIAREGIL